MHRSPALSVLLMFFSTVGAAFAAPPDDDVAGALRRAEEKAWQSAATGSFAAWAALYADDVEIDTPGVPPVRGRDAAVARLTRRGRKEAEGEAKRFDVAGDRAVETALGSATEGGALSSIRVVFWERQADGAWKIRREIVAGDAPAAAGEGRADSPPSSAPEAPARAVSPGKAAGVSSPAEEVLAIPDARSLSDGFVRTVGEQLRSRAARIRSADASGSPEARRAAVDRADRELRKLVRDIGWIDVNRFGTAASCDAALIVAESRDAPLIRAAVPLMNDLESNPESSGCERAAREALRALPPR